MRKFEVERQVLERLSEGPGKPDALVELAEGQQPASGYAIWAGRRWRRLGHLFQRRYRAEMIEDESYY